MNSCSCCEFNCCQQRMAGKSPWPRNLEVFSFAGKIFELYLDPLHFRGKNGRSKKIGQTWSNNPNNDSLCSKHVCFWENLSTTPPYTKRVEFWNSTKIRKLPEQQDFRICGFLRVFCVFFLRGFAGFFLSRLRRCNHFFAFVSPSPNTCNQSPKIEDQSSI